MCGWNQLRQWELRLGGNGARGLDSPDEVGQGSEGEDCGGVSEAGWNGMRGRDGGHLQVNVREGVWDLSAAGADAGGASTPRNHDETDGGPEDAGTLARGGEGDGPSHEIGRAEIDHSAGLKPDVLDRIDWAMGMTTKGRVGSRKENEPAESQDGTRDDIEGCEKAERDQAEGGPRSAGGECLEVALAAHGVGEIVDGAETDKGGGFSFGKRTAFTYSFCAQIGKVIGGARRGSGGHDGARHRRGAGARGAD